MSFFKEFKEFAVKGSAMDLAIGVVIGAAFGKVVTSLTNDVIMPPLGLLLGRVDFKDMQFVLQHKQGDTPEVAIRLGLFINTVIDFLIVALAIFLVVKFLNMARDNAILPWHQTNPPAPTPDALPPDKKD